MMQSGTKQAYRLLTHEDGYPHNPQVDDDIAWYCIECRYSFGDWIEYQDKSLWNIIGQRHHAKYAIREELMMFILLRGNNRLLYEQT